jgi:hypothetical protein
MHDITEFEDKFCPFYSYTNAVGVIMGTGNVGPYLTHDRATTNTYLSRDGGLTWSEAHKGDFIYEFGNHGGLLIMANWLSETRQAFFSTNQGHSWQTLQFSEQPLNVSNILTELNAMSTNFVLFGMRGSQGVLYHLDFASMGTRVCHGLNTADNPNSDYETWTPSDGRSGEGERCLLGRQTMYSRRKQLAECLNHHELDWPIDMNNCTCTEENFECVAGFHRGIESMECLPEHQSDFLKDDDGRPGVCAHKKFHELDAYRHVSGDSCAGGWMPKKFRLQCEAIKEMALRSHNPPRSRWISWPLFFKSVAVLLGLVILCCLSRLQRVQNCASYVRIKLSGQKDYSKPSSAPPSAASDPTNIGAPSKPTEMHNFPSA